MARLPVLLLPAVLAAAGCTVERREPVAPVRQAAAANGLLPAPHDSLIPAGALGVSIRRGRALLHATRDSLPGFVGNQLTCTSCHLDFGLRAHASPWVGVYGRFPQYRARNARTNIIEDRINDCIQRSLAGKALPPDGPDMRDMIAYMAWLSRGVPVGADVEGQGFAMLTPLEADPARGERVYADGCARCHGDDGHGTLLGPPVWGPGSYTIGAGMARVRTAAAFIRRNMPRDTPGLLTDQDAFDVAAYINSRPRPDFPGKENDWPLGDPPPDVAYETRAGRRR
jgi:thiosulfate dehydrogenase